jgi:hypothetical protein
MSSQNKQNLRSIVRGLYDIQKLRIQIGNRIVANFKAKELGQTAGMSEKELEKEEKDILKTLRLRYKKITDGIKSFPSKNRFTPDELISTYAELCLIRSYLSLETEEKTMGTQLGNALKDFPIYTEFLEDVKGCGPLMSGVIISEIDIYKAKYPSSVHLYSGLDVAPDGRGRSRRKEHLVETEYVDAEGEIKTKKGITFNPFLKTKLIGVLGSSFLRSKSKYADIYYNYKHRLENHKDHKEKSKGHIHNMAVRYAVKRFLIDLHMKWRELEGLEVSQPYEVAKLGYNHGSPADTPIPTIKTNEQIESCVNINSI